MKIFLFLISIFSIFSLAEAQNTNIRISSKLILNCKFEKVILKNPNYNFETFTRDKIKREDVNKLIIESKTPDTLMVRNLSQFINNANLEVKIANKDIILIQAYDKNRNYSESAVLTKKTGELIHEITFNIKEKKKEKDISFYRCKKI